MSSITEEWYPNKKTDDCYTFVRAFFNVLSETINIILRALIQLVQLDDILSHQMYNGGPYSRVSYSLDTHNFFTNL